MTRATTEQSDDTAQVTGDYEQDCTCCEPPNKLVPRPDLGMDGPNPTYALCVFHMPEPTVYRWDGTRYVQRTDLKLDAMGRVVTTTGEPDSETTDREPLGPDPFQDKPGPSGGVDVDRSGMGPAPDERVHVDLSEDEFYSCRILSP